MWGKKNTFITGGIANWTLWKSVWRVLIKLKIDLPQAPAVPT